MTENLYGLERLTDQKRIEIQAEVHRDHVAAELTHATQENGTTFWHRLVSLVPVPVFTTRRSRTSAKQSSGAASDPGEATPVTS